jgi:hypothetical protein
MNRSLFLPSAVILALGCGVIAGSANAAVVVNVSSNVASGGAPGDVHDPAIAGAPDQFAASNSDLLAGMIPVVSYTGGSGSTTAESARGATAWTDGLISTIYNGAGVALADAHAAYGVVNGTVGGSNIDTLLSFDLGQWYNLTSVDLYTGWNDSGRDDTSFNLWVSSDNVDFVLVASYLKPGDNTGAFTTPVTNLHRIIDDNGASIAEGIRYLQFQFTDSDNGYAGVVEIDAFGTMIPEPASVLLLALGGLASVVRRRP